MSFMAKTRKLPYTGTTYQRTVERDGEMVVEYDFRIRAGNNKIVSTDHVQGYANEKDALEVLRVILQQGPHRVFDSEGIEYLANGTVEQAAPRRRGLRRRR